jgi:type I restriction enzyme S subunit
MGQSPSSDFYNTESNGLPFFQGKAEFAEVHPVVQKWCSSPNKIADKDDILLSVRAPVGPTNIANVKCCIGRGLAAIRYKLPECHKFLFYYLRCIEKSLAGQGTGSTFSAISGSVIKNQPFPLPPLPEQHRIVAKIEELFSDLDAGIASLRKAKEQLKTYRQSVLKWAFEGKLTEEWRKKNKPEPACELLKRIKAEREKKYKEESDKAKKEGTRAPRKMEELPPISEEELDKLSRQPDGWAWIYLKNVTEGPEYGSSAKSKKEGKIPVLRMGNIQNCFFDWSDLVFSNNPEEIRKYWLKPGDVLFNRTNSPELVGKTALYKGERDAIFAGYLIRVNQVKQIVPGYLNYFLNSGFAHEYGNKVKTDGVNQSNINGEKLGKYRFPLCSETEQEEILLEIESRLSVADNLEKTIDASLAQAAALRQSILKRAFEGKLVPQDPKDEPAEKLLERIKNVRTADSRRLKDDADFKIKNKEESE